MANPSYTIAIPVYERIFGFKEALQSAIMVDGCTEILVVDDNSSHLQFEDICKSFDDSRVKYVRNGENLGLFGNWNRGIETAKSEFISILCSDDLIAPDAFTLFLTANSMKNDIDVFFGPFATFKKNKEDAVVHKIYKDGEVKGIELLADAIKNGPCFPVLSIMRRTTMLKYPFVSKPHSGNDWLWIYSNAMSFNLYSTCKVINYWRRHVNQDAVLSKSITMDCWPLMYKLMAMQLSDTNTQLSRKAMRGAKRIILCWLLDEDRREKKWQKRLLSGAQENNKFIDEVLEIIKDDWLLRSLLKDQGGNKLIYGIGKIMRKVWY